jgi:glucose dehydrogenase
VLLQFDRNGIAYTLNRETGALLNANKYDSQATHTLGVDLKTGRPVFDKRYSPGTTGPDVEVKSTCPGAGGTQSSTSYDRKSGLVMVPSNYACMTYEPFQVEYTTGQPYTGAALTLFPTPRKGADTSNLIAWDPVAGKIAWSKPEQFAVWSGALTTAGEVTFYGSLDGYIKAVSPKDGKELWKFKVPSGITGNVFTYEYAGKQFVGVYSGRGDWEDPAGPDKGLAKYTTVSGSLFIFSLPAQPSGSR